MDETKRQRLWLASLRHTWMRVGLVAAVLIGPVAVSAQECPGPSATLGAVRNAVSDMARRARAPAAAQCAAGWSGGVTLSREKLTDATLLAFFTEAADVHRRAYETRKAGGLAVEAAKFLDTEIELRRRWISAALESGGPALDETVRRATVKHISSLAGALALRQRFAEIADVLGNTEPYVIDEAAVSVWLQAVFSCASFDGAGSAAKLCTPENMESCRSRITVFLEAVDQMKGRQYPPQTRRDLVQLRSLSTDSRCQK